MCPSPPPGGGTNRPRQTNPSDEYRVSTSNDAPGSRDACATARPTAQSTPVTSRSAMLSILLGPRKNPPHSALERTVGVVVVAVEDSDPGPHEPGAIAAFVHRMQSPWSAGFRLW